MVNIDSLANLFFVHFCFLRNKLRRDRVSVCLSVYLHPHPYRNEISAKDWPYCNLYILYLVITVTIIVHSWFILLRHYQYCVWHCTDYVSHKNLSQCCCPRIIIALTYCGRVAFSVSGRSDRVEWKVCGPIEPPPHNCHSPSPSLPASHYNTRTIFVLVDFWVFCHKPCNRL